MKKILILLLVLCLLGVIIAGCALQTKPEEAQESEESAEPTPAEPTADPGSQEPAVGKVDYDAIYQLHAPDEVVMVIDGEEFIWEDYFYFFYSRGTQMDQQFQMYQYYGYAMGWDSAADDEGHTYADLLNAYPEEMLRQIAAIEKMARDNQIELNEEEEEQIRQEHEDAVVGLCGENASEEDFNEALKDMHLRRELYDRLLRVNYLYRACYLRLYGENGELLDEQVALKWLADNGVISADHILIATVDLSTGQALDEAAVEERTALARELADELQAIENTEARIARFLELKEQYDEDGNAYVFGPGVMVEEFYDGALALAENQVSDPVKSVYGYHIILRRPLDLDEEVFTGGGTELSGRATAANQIYAQRMDELMDAQQVEYEAGFTAPNLLKYYEKPIYTE